MAVKESRKNSFKATFLLQITVTVLWVIAKKDKSAVIPPGMSGNCQIFFYSQCQDSIFWESIKLEIWPQRWRYFTATIIMASKGDNKWEGGDMSVGGQVRGGDTSVEGGIHGGDKSEGGVISMGVTHQWERGISMGGKCEQRSHQAWSTVCSNTTSRLSQRQGSKNLTPMNCVWICRPN